MKANRTANLTVETPVGALTLTARDDAIVSVAWGGGGPATAGGVLADAGAWLRAYFSGAHAPLTVPLNPGGTDFQRQVWQALSRIPVGAPATYGDIARLLGSGARAVGGACGANPIPILIPCHRVVAAYGSLGGYSGFGGLTTKLALLDLESSQADSSRAAQAA